MPRGIGYGKKKKRGFKKGTLIADTKPGSVDDDAKKRIKDRKKKLREALGA
jgi:hypothetical protein